ncbi:MAG: transporter substrate-binding domain-containing protein [Ruminococcaceae bacterium]|nr:transporter substrate-binding domain-containing protein [Oscillospiraceae bacterium]
MKKILSILSLVMVAVLMLTGCASSDKGIDAKNDLMNIKAAGKMVIGITESAPMNYYDEEGNLVGFDTEYAKVVCERLGVEAEFKIINWNTKEKDLEKGEVDAVWNGLTVNKDRRKDMDFTKVYLTNKQCVVIDKSDVSVYTSAQKMKDAVVTAEAGSAGEVAVSYNRYLSKADYVPSGSQSNALIALAAGNADGAVVDITFAFSNVGKGDYKNLMIVEDITLSDEEYAVGLRKGSDLTAEINRVTDELIEDGTLLAIAAEYGLAERVAAALSNR